MIWIKINISIHLIEFQLIWWYYRQVMAFPSQIEDKKNISNYKVI